VADDLLQVQCGAVTIDEIRRALSLSRMSVYNALRNGQIPSLRIGKRYVVTREMFTRFLEGRDLA
jgi:excisionase family DNA binding protein